MGRRPRVLIPGEQPLIKQPTGWRKGVGYPVGVPLTPEQLAMHIQLMHGVWVEDIDSVTVGKLPISKVMAELDECHRECHDVPIGFEIPHVHEDQEIETEWEW